MDIKIYRNRLIDGKYEKTVFYSVPLDNTDSQLASKDAKESHSLPRYQSW